MQPTTNYHVQLGKNIVKGTTPVSGHSLKLQFCMFEKSQRKHNNWIVINF
jgi:hypothetical protein